MTSVAHTPLGRHRCGGEVISEPRARPTRYARRAGLRRLLTSRHRRDRYERATGSRLTPRGCEQFWCPHAPSSLPSLTVSTTVGSKTAKHPVSRDPWAPQTIPVFLVDRVNVVASSRASSYLPGEGPRRLNLTVRHGYTNPPHRIVAPYYDFDSLHYIQVTTGAPMRACDAGCGEPGSEGRRRRMRGSARCYAADDYKDRASDRRSHSWRTACVMGFGSRTDDMSPLGPGRRDQPDNARSKWRQVRRPCAQFSYSNDRTSSPATPASVRRRRRITKRPEDRTGGETSCSQPAVPVVPGRARTGFALTPRVAPRAAWYVGRRRVARARGTCSSTGRRDRSRSTHAFRGRTIDVGFGWRKASVDHGRYLAWRHLYPRIPDMIAVIKRDYASAPKVSIERLRRGSVDSSRLR